MAHISKRHEPNCIIKKDKTKKCNCDGAWRARYPNPTPPPHKPTAQIERKFRTRKEAEVWLASQQHAVHTGTHIDPTTQNTTYGQLADAWKATWRDLEPKTRAGYDSILNTHLLPEFGGTRLANLTLSRIESFLSRLSETNAPGTVRNVFAALRTSLNTAVRLRLVHTNPTQGIKPPRPRSTPMLVLEPQEIQQLADAIDPYYRTLIFTAAYTGLRAGELLALRRSDIDLLRGVVHVRRALKEVNGVLSFGPTKTHRERTVSLPKFLIKMLNDHLAHPLPGGSGPDALAFPGPRGGPLRPAATSTGATSGPPSRAAGTRRGMSTRARSRGTSGLSASTTSGTRPRACSSRRARTRN